MTSGLLNSRFLEYSSRSFSTCHLPSFVPNACNDTPKQPPSSIQPLPKKPGLAYRETHLKIPNHQHTSNAFSTRQSTEGWGGLYPDQCTNPSGCPTPGPEHSLHILLNAAPHQTTRGETRRASTWCWQAGRLCAHLSIGRLRFTNLCAFWAPSTSQDMEVVRLSIPAPGAFSPLAQVTERTQWPNGRPKSNHTDNYIPIKNNLNTPVKSDIVKMIKKQDPTTCRLQEMHPELPRHS